MAACHLFVLALLILSAALILSQDPNIPEMRRKMKQDWMNLARFKPRRPTEKENEYLRNCSRDSQQRYNYQPFDGRVGVEAANLNPAVADLSQRCKKKEIRTLTDSELKTFVSTFREWNTRTVDPISGTTQQETFVNNHRFDRAPEAHFSACFSTWHQSYLEMFEIALRLINASACPVFWDSTLDQCLPDSSHSAFFSDDLMGTRWGQVTSGLFANLQVRPTDCRNGGQYLYRRVVNGTSGSQYLFSDSIVAAMYSNADIFADLCYNVDTTFEDRHGLGHMFIDGIMGIIPCSPCDPIFWCHHENINRLFKNFVHLKPMTNPDRREYYPSDSITDPGQRYDDPMQPLDEAYPNMTCGSGINSSYDNGYTQYEDPPSTCTVDADCRSPFLWCNPNCRGKRRCSAKIKENGDCTGFSSTACYKNKACNGTMSCVRVGFRRYCRCQTATGSIISPVS